MVPSEAASAGDETPVRGSSSTGRNRRENQQDEESVEKNYYFYATTSIDTRDRISQDDFLQKFGDSLKGLQEAADDNDSFVLKRSVPSSPAVDEDESDNDTFWTTQEMEGSIRNELKSSVSSHLDAKLDADAEQKVIEEAAKLFIKEPSSFSSATSDNESNLGDNKKFKMENGNGNHVGISLKPINNGALRRMSRHLSRELVKRRSSLMESMPETPAGWSVLISALASISLGHEIQLQKKLTCPPLVFGQCGPNADSDSPLQKIYEKLTERPESILSRNIQPSLFIGTRGAVASTASYLLGGPPSTEEHITFRQVLTMSTDGTKIAIDWELPPQAQIDSSPLSEEERKQQVMSRGGIQQPVVLVLHG